MIDTKAQLDKMMLDICSQVVERVSNYILEDIRDSILKNTYGSYGPNAVYSPTMEFLQSFEWKNIERSTRNISKQLFYNFQNMRSDPSTYTHAAYPGKEDTREILASLLNIHGIDPYNPISVNREPFWDLAMQELFDGKKIDNYFLQEFENFGIYGV